MKTIRVIVTFILIMGIIGVVLFQDEITKREQVGRINEWVLYYKDYEGQEVLSYEDYVVRDGFLEKSLDEAFEEGLFTESEVQDILDMIEEWEN